MYRILQIGRTGLDTFQRKMDSISNNIANVQTTGYKSLKVQFEDLVYDQVANKGVPLSLEAREKPTEIGTGSRVKSIERQFEQGIPRETSNPLDLAIQGEGFFGVRDEGGNLLLTRDGAFTVDSNGQLVDSRGNPVVGEFKFPLSQWKNIAIDESGTITVENELGQIQGAGKITLFTVVDKNALTSVGGNYFSVENAGDLLNNQNGNEGWGKIRQGFLEQSNVDIGEELVNMLIAQRAYQINTKSITAGDEMWNMVNQLRR